MMNHLKRYFLTGLAILVPIAITVYVLVFIFSFVDNILGRYINAYLKETLGFYIPGLGLVLFLLIVVLSGFIATRLLGDKLFVQLEKWFSGLPLIKNIYPIVKQIIQFISAQKEFGFKKVVLIEYPGKGVWSLGFLTNEQFEPINKALSKEMVAVYVSTVPGPLTGNLVFVAKEDVRFPELSVGEALRIIISGGVVKKMEG